MAQNGRLHLTALCAVTSFIWISYNFEHHTLNQRPRYALAIVLLLSAGLTWLVSYSSKWLPGSDARFDEKTPDQTSALSSSEHAPLSLPRRPRRYFIPIIVFCIIIRIELFHQTAAKIQCSVPGIEAFFCTLVVVYDVFFGRKSQSDVLPWPTDPWVTVADELQQWFKTTRLTLVASVVLFNLGAYLAAANKVHSTYFCSTLFDNRFWIVSMQVFGLVLDGVIAVLLWRVLVFTKSTRARLRTLSGIQLTVGAFDWTMHVLLTLRPTVQPTGVNGLGWLYLFDLINDSFTFCLLIVSLSLLVTESGPVKPFGIITFISSLLTSYQALSSVGDAYGGAKIATLGPFILIASGFGLFMYTANLRSVLFVRRAFLLFILTAAIIGSTVYVILTNQVLNKHPLDTFIYDARTEADRWLTHASVSRSLKVAVQEYQARHNGRDPPPNFDKWYEFAIAKSSVIVDHYQQIENDVAPFWSLKPNSIRKSTLDLAANEAELALVQVANKKVTHNYKAEDEHRRALDDLVKMIETFSEYLSDMDLPINLSGEPRVLTPWSDLGQHPRQALDGKYHMNTRRSENPKDSTPAGQTPEVPGSKPVLQAFLSPSLFREMEAQICPAGSSGRTLQHWNVRDLCVSCVSGHSEDHFLKKWEVSLERCSQPDLSRLHAFHMTNKKMVPHQKLVPVFGSFKADGFNDILIPMTSKTDSEADSNRDFKTRIDKLHWRGELGEQVISHDMLHGNHRHRLLHQVNNATKGDEVTMLLPTPGDPKKFSHERVHVQEANAALPFDVGVSSYPSCEDAGCAAARLEFGEKGEEGESGEPLKYRYVLLLDDDSSPPKRLMQTLRSGSVPVLSSIFRTWCTERLLPWVHFVPVDIRFQALHSTLAYFTGLEGRVPVNGREIKFEGRVSDAKWIATAGRQWADKALRREDMEVYLFRLLLEWGRVVDDGRDSLGFKIES
ncbi:hypothetical protein VDGE_06808 [Verticillium dahliae]|uniref:Glycosyl transferase CAP10 domain-containing protein n=1 Tax=Verticillium dahliae TaxID=27337 RepID=A0A444S7Y8_VERDA|nr:hypothetical protein VDGE_06808 [Verticillium dahliae]